MKNLNIDNTTISILILSIFCAGGLFAYIRETLRLQKLITSGKLAKATILKKEKIKVSESIVHYLVTYEFIDDQGKSIIHEQDLNNLKWFNNMAEGEKIDILYDYNHENSYPISQINENLKISHT